MENSKKPAFYNPNSYSMQGDDGIGLTKREYFAIHILSGMNANGMTTQEGVQPPYCMLIEDRVKYAVEQADALLAELDKE
jgi:hypothetical protein